MEWIERIVHGGTLLIINALMAALSSAIFLALYVTRQKVRSYREVFLWGMSNAAFAAGFGVLILPAFHVDFAGLSLVGNLLIDTGAVLGLLAVITYLELPKARLWVLAPASLMALVEIYCVLTAGENLRLMVILGGALTGMVTVATGAALWQCVDKPRRPVARLAAAFHFLWAFVLLVRIAWWFVHPSAAHSQDPTSTFGLLFRLILTWVITPSFLWMMTRQLDAELIRYAYQDPLTGIANRRVIWDEGERIAAEVDRPNTTMAVLMIDIDHFKAINDRWGHDSGDQVLVAIAQTLDRHIRSGDFFARVGGEEFMVLTPRSEESTVKDIAERLRRAVEGQVISLPCGDQWNGTISIGYCISLRGQINWREVVNAADQALYAAKHRGRNCIEGTRLSGLKA